MSLTDKDIEVEEAIIKAEGDGTALSASAGSSMGDVKKFLSLVREENPLLGGELDQATSLRFRWVLDGSPVPRPLVLEMGFRSELFFHRFFCGWWGKSSSRRSLESLLEKFICEPVEIRVAMDTPPIKGSLDAESERKEARGE